MKILRAKSLTMVFLSLFALTAVSCWSFGQVSASSTTSSASAAAIVAEACTMTSTIDSAHSATLSPGTSKGLGNSGGVDGIGQTTLKVVCNDNAGFAIYAVGFTNNTYGNNKLIGRLSNEQIITGTNTSGNTSNWAMQVNAVSGTYAPTIQNSFNAAAYHNVPDSYLMVAKRTSGTDAGTNPTGSRVTATYGAYVTSAQVADTYEGKVKYTLVHPNNASGLPAHPEACPSGKICYFANGTNVVGTMGQPTVSTSATSATLLASNFSRQGYGFAGWSDVYDYDTNPNAHFYGPQEDITFTAGQYTGSNPGLSLYAVWIKSQGNLQDSTKATQVCTNLTQAPTNGTANLDSVSALTDQRDNETYAIAKLADGKCWMIENLRLEAEDSDDESLAQGFGKSTTYGNFTGLATAESANFTATTGATAATTANSIYYAGTQSGTATINISQTSYAGCRMPRYNNYNHQSNSSNRPSNPTSNDSTNATTSAGIYSYGNYYTWSAAIANTIYYGGPTATDANGKTSETVGTSLCPAGWKLPYGRNSGNGATSGGFSYLDIQLGGTGADSSFSTTPTGVAMSRLWRKYPNNFLYSGYFNASSVSGRGSYGSYWSSTVSSYSTSYILRLDSSLVYPGTDIQTKYYGRSIRCLLSPSAGPS